MNMLDIVQWIFMLLCLPVAVIVILTAFPLTQKARWILGVGLVAWYVFTAFVQVPQVGHFPGALFGILLPVIAISAFMIASPKARRVIAGCTVWLLVALHTTRVAGGLFIPLNWEGRLSDPFALIAGSGDLLAAALAVPAALIAYRGRPGWEKWVLMWNVLGFADFMSAIFLGITSQPGSPLQMFANAPGTAILGELPWRFIPSYFVPLYIIIHVVLFIRLIPRQSHPLPG
jgi:hypothetical protein